MKFKPTRSISAAELMAQIRDDPEFVRNSNEKETQLKAMEARLRAEETPILTELAGVQIQVTSVWELVNAKSSYSAAIPVLAKHLRLQYHPKIREGLARALTVKQAQGVAGRAILEELMQGAINAREVRWALANALTQAADVSMAGEIEALIADKNYKDIREILVVALRNLVTLRP